MTLIDQTRDLARSFMHAPRHVRIRTLAVERVAGELVGVDLSASWPRLEMSNIDAVIYELAANAVNYAYWYGRGSVRPGGSSSTRMYECLDAAWTKHGSDWPETIRAFAANMAEMRIPYASERTEHLLELIHPLDGTALFEMANFALHSGDADAILRRMVRAYPGYAADPFLKRAFLLLIQLHRRGLLPRDVIASVPVPTDYQIPKILRHLGVLNYEHSLACAIEKEELIASGSLEEIEIRAATLVACDRIAELAGITPADVDTYLWLNRKGTSDPFHLTVTTHY